VKQCEHCQKDFRESRSDQKFCSSSCRVLALRARRALPLQPGEAALVKGFEGARDGVHVVGEPACDVPAEIAEAVAQAEGEATASLGEPSTVQTDSTLPVECVAQPLYKDPGVYSSGPAWPAGPVVMPVTALPDLRERVEMLRDAWVRDYRDGSLEIHFDTEARARAMPSARLPDEKW